MPNNRAVAALVDAFCVFELLVMHVHIIELADDILSALQEREGRAEQGSAD